MNKNIKKNTFIGITVLCVIFIFTFLIIVIRIYKCFLNRRLFNTNFEVNNNNKEDKKEDDNFSNKEKKILNKYNFLKNNLIYKIYDNEMCKLTKECSICLKKFIKNSFACLFSSFIIIFFIVHVEKIILLKVIEIFA